MAIKTDENAMDLRVKRTRTAVRKAFLEMCREIPFSKMNVSNLTERATVNRRTFYLHYEELEDVMDDIEQIYMAELRKELVDDTSEKGLEKNIYTVFEFIKGKQDVMDELLYGKGGYGYFAKKFVNDVLALDCFADIYNATEMPEMSKELFRTIFSIYRKWELKPGRKSMKKLAHQCAVLILHGWRGFENEEEEKDGDEKENKDEKMNEKDQ